MYRELKESDKEKESEKMVSDTCTVKMNVMCFHAFPLCVMLFLLMCFRNSVNTVSVAAVPAA